MLPVVELKQETRSGLLSFFGGQRVSAKMLLAVLDLEIVQSLLDVAAQRYMNFARRKMVPVFVKESVHGSMRAKWEMETNETVEKHDFDGENYTQTQGLNALLGNDPFCPSVHNWARSSSMTDIQLTIPKVWILPMLWTRANNLHWISTLDFVRKVKRFNRF